MSLFELIILATAVLTAHCLILACAWLLWRKTGNAGWIDATWSFGVGMVGVCAAIIPFDHSLHWRQWAMVLLAALWSLRLGFHIARRSQGAGDDPRYRALAEEWGASAARRMFWFLQSQAAVGALLSFSIAVAAQNSNPQWRNQDLITFFLFAASVAGEALADVQLKRFREAGVGDNGLCDRGLWAWSRHPNYFFEWLFWVAVAVAAVDVNGRNPYGWLAIFAPIAMYWVLVKISGIPPLEVHMLRSRGNAFRDYQRRTSQFFPVPPGLKLALTSVFRNSRSGA